jgi:transcriptional regulator with XRE-family HTH domain
MEFGNRLLELAKHYDISVNAIAERASIKRTTLQTYLPNGSRQPAKPSIDAIVNIFKAFPEIQLEWLLTGDGLMIGNSKVIDTQIKLAVESNLDYKEKYYKLTEKVITLQDELNDSRLELINCLKSKIKLPLKARTDAEVM